MGSLSGATVAAARSSLTFATGLLDGPVAGAATCSTTSEPEFLLAVMLEADAKIAVSLLSLRTPFIDCLSRSVTTAGGSSPPTELGTFVGSVTGAVECAIPRWAAFPFTPDLHRKCESEAAGSATLLLPLEPNPFMDGLCKAEADSPLPVEGVVLGPLSDTVASPPDFLTPFMPKFLMGCLSNAALTDVASPPTSRFGCAVGCLSRIAACDALLASQSLDGATVVACSMLPGDGLLVACPAKSIATCLDSPSSFPISLATCRVPEVDAIAAAFSTSSEARLVVMWSGFRTPIMRRYTTSAPRRDHFLT
mmetsp:Transcript_46175/g.100546  ORF Transcript_46175/g.100546 Transcript_46175/m.100546 type:complete len:308 (+) Transcript_46175:174-1097(+)